MKKLFYFLAISFLIISCETKQEEPPVSEIDIKIKQKLFAELMVDEYHALSAKWDDDKTLILVYKPEFMRSKKNVENDNPRYNSKLVSDTLAVSGYDYIGKNICVEIYYPDETFVTKSCYKTKFSE